MKTRLTTLVILLLLAGSVFLQIRSRRVGNDERAPTDPLVMRTSPSTTNLPPATIPERIGSTMRAARDAVERGAEYRAINFAPIAVSGSVLDQFDNPLRNVPIEFTIGRSTIASSATEKGTTTTDKNGAFHISGYEGAAIAIVPKLDGFILIPTNNRVIYSAFSMQDPLYYRVGGTNRVIRMWRMRGAEELVRVSKSFRGHPEQMPLHIDLVRGEIVLTGGDLTITTERPPGNISTKDQARWAITISAVDGGIQKMDKLGFPFTYEAPAEGYSEGVTVEQTPGDRMWATYVEIGVSVMSRHGTVYSRVGIGFSINGEPGEPCSMAIHSLSNPNGSRNWEEDPNKIETIR